MKFYTTNIKKALKSSKSSTLFDIEYSDDEKECLQNFKINKVEEYNHYGTIKLNKLKLFLENLGDNDPKKVILLKNIIKKISKTVIDAYKNEYFWITIRVTSKTDFPVPRWHKDGPYFEGTDERNDETKFFTTLIGPSTYMIKDEKYIKIYNVLEKKELDEIKKAYDLLKGKYMDEEERKISYKYSEIYRQKLKKVKIIQPTNYQGIIFKVGTNDSLIHSEPESNEPRIYISIVSGTKKEIKLLQQRFEQ